MELSHPLKTRKYHYIGKSNNTQESNANFEGAISSLHIWDYALSASEVQSLYNKSGRPIKSLATNSPIIILQK